MPNQTAKKKTSKSYVYYNLHKACWSVMERGRVVAHAEYLCVKDAQFRVRPAGRKRVLLEKRKNVHAFVVGTVIYDKVPTPIFLDKVTYDPYKVDTFVLADSGKKVTNSPLVYLDSSRTAWALCPE